MQIAYPICSLHRLTGTAFRFLASNGAQGKALSELAT
jgi:hypothetical protein